MFKNGDKMLSFIYKTKKEMKNNLTTYSFKTLKGSWSVAMLSLYNCCKFRGFLHFYIFYALTEPSYVALASSFPQFFLWKPDLFAIFGIPHL